VDLSRNCIRAAGAGGPTATARTQEQPQATRNPPHRESGTDDGRNGGKWMFRLADHARFQVVHLRVRVRVRVAVIQRNP